MKNSKNFESISRNPRKISQQKMQALPHNKSNFSKRIKKPINLELERQSLYWGILIILLGLLTIFSGLFLDAKQLSELEFGTFLNTIGTTILTMGFFQIVLDLKSWRDYFEERIISVFKKQDFLINLEEKELMEIQINTLKAYFKDDSFAREGSFFEYYKRHLQRLIEEPYREDVHFSIIVHDSLSNNCYLDISLVASYICRRGSHGDIQPNVFWSIHSDDIKVLKSFQIQLQHFEERNLPEIELVKFNEQSWREEFNEKTKCSQNLNQDCKNCPRISLENKNSCTGNNREIIYYLSNKGKDNEEIGFCYPFSKEYKELDKLHVLVKAEYIIPIERLRIFKMYFLSKNVTFSIHYPNGFDIDFYSFGVFKDSLMISKEKNYYRCHYDSWMLPDTGIVWRLKTI